MESCIAHVVVCCYQVYRSILVFQAASRELRRCNRLPSSEPLGTPRSSRLVPLPPLLRECARSVVDHASTIELRMFVRTG
jgi:hypothetical protein